MGQGKFQDRHRQRVEEGTDVLLEVYQRTPDFQAHSKRRRAARGRAGGPVVTLLANPALETTSNCPGSGSPDERE